MDDFKIVELYHRREERAIAESEKKYGRLCRSVALRLLGMREDAEECVNETWYAAWNRMPPERPEFLGTFLGRITRNLAVSRWRKEHAKKRFSGLETLLSELEDCVPAPGTAEEAVERRQLGEWISAWLEEQETEDRWLFLRRYWYGDSVKTLAQTLSEKSNTCSQRLLRLRRSLCTYLENKE